MRTKLREVRDRESLADWWLETPWKRLRNYKTLLFEPGLGWLRWGIWRDSYQYSYYEPPESIAYIPPLRRAWLYLEGPIVWVLTAGGWHKIDAGFDDRPQWIRFHLSEHRETWAGLQTAKDPDWPEFYFIA